MELRTLADMCRLFAISDTNLHDLVKRGIIPRASRGRYNLDECAPAYIRHLRAMAAGRTDQTGKIDIVAERARHEREKADKVAMQNAVARGELVAADDVEDMHTAVHSAVQRHLLSLPAIVAPLVAIEDDARACETIFREHLEDALEQLADADVTPSKAAAADPAEDDKPDS